MPGPLPDPKPRILVSMQSVAEIDHAAPFRRWCCRQGAPVPATAAVGSSAGAEHQMSRSCCISSRVAGRIESDRSQTMKGPGRRDAGMSGSGVPIGRFVRQRSNAIAECGRGGFKIRRPRGYVGSSPTARTIHFPSYRFWPAWLLRSDDGPVFESRRVRANLQSDLPGGSCLDQRILRYARTMMVLRRSRIAF